VGVHAATSDGHVGKYLHAHGVVGKRSLKPDEQDPHISTHAPFDTREESGSHFEVSQFNQQNPGSPLKDNVMVYYKFKNEQKAGLGMPIPAANLRVYQKDSKGQRSRGAVGLWASVRNCGHLPQTKSRSTKPRRDAISAPSTLCDMLSLFFFDGC